MSKITFHYPLIFGGFPISIFNLPVHSHEILWCLFFVSSSVKFY